MDSFSRELLKEYDIKIPNGYEIVDCEEDILIEDDHKIYHWPNKKFYLLEWWKKNAPNNDHVLNGIIVQDMVAIRLIPKPKVYVPVRPEKPRAIMGIRNIVIRMKR